jgi:hypothetical protein
MKMAARILAAVAGLCLFACTSHAAFVHTWNAGSGLYPDADCFWHLAASDPSLSTLGGGLLQIATGASGDAIYYYQSGADLAIPDPWVIEVRMRVGTDNGTGQAATSAAVGFATAADVENLLFIGAGHIYLWSGYFVMGPQAFLDTQSALHTYRIEVTGAGAVSVFYDGALTLTGTTLVGPPYEDSTYLWWGDGTSHASGTSYWEHVTHNGNAFDTCIPTSARRSTWGDVKRTYR